MGRFTRSKQHQFNFTNTSFEQVCPRQRFLREHVLPDNKQYRRACNSHDLL